MRSVVRRFLGGARLQAHLAAYAYTNFAFLLSRVFSDVNPLVVYYHIVSDEKVSHVGDLYRYRTVRQFKKDMDVLCRFYRPLSLREFLRCVEQGQAPARNSVMLTFDDGLRECCEIIAPILKEKGIPSTFFLCSAFVDNRRLAYDFKKVLLASEIARRGGTLAEGAEVRAILGGAGRNRTSLEAAILDVDYLRAPVLDKIAAVLEYDFQSYLTTIQPYLTSEQVVELLAMGHAIGAHSIDHPRFADISLAEQMRQTLDSIRFVREKFSLDYGAFAFPHSDACVSREFFRQIFETGAVDVCFGNQGLLDDSVAGIVQRTSMERTMLPAEGILGRSYARRFVKALAGELVVRRS